jgi:cutinase
MTVGPMLCSALKTKYGDKFGCQGIGGGYTAALTDNFKPKGTSDDSIKAAVGTFQAAATKCPNAALTFVGYR